MHLVTRTGGLDVLTDRHQLPLVGNVQGGMLLFFVSSLETLESVLMNCSFIFVSIV